LFINNKIEVIIIATFVIYMAKGGINLGAIGRGGDSLVNEFVEGVLHKHIR
jgi:hypothetical protein